jgi:hypothetical protein
MKPLRDRDPTPPEPIDDDVYIEVLENMTGTQIADWMSKRGVWMMFCADHLNEAERLVDEKAGER